jgi:ABC-2 type transport system permease protein
MTTFGSFVHKETLHILRDTRTMMIVLLMPVVLILLFSYAISTEVNNVRFAVVSPHYTSAVLEQVRHLEANPNLRFAGFIEPTEIDATLRQGKADVVLCYSADYDRISAGIEQGASMQLVADMSNPNNGTMATAVVQGAILSSQASLAAALQPDIRILYNPQMKSSFNFVPGVLGLVFMLICGMMTSVSIVREKEVGTMEILLVSPVKPLQIILAKMTPYFMISCLNLTTALLLAKYLLQLPLTGSITALIIISVLFIVLALGLGLLISVMVSKQIVAILISGMLLMIPVMMLSGMMFPIENLPHFFRELSVIIPARWYIAALRKLMIQGLPFLGVWKEMLIISVMTLGILSISLKRFNDRLA